MFFKNGATVRKLKLILGFVGGGVHKRIDENREMLELLRREAPDLLANRPWIARWIKANDEFFCELESVVPIDKGQFLSQTGYPEKTFPRPWPSEDIGVTATPTDPSYWGISDEVRFFIYRGDQVSQSPCSFTELLDFLDACDIDPVRDEAQVSAVIAGIPFEIDGASMRFEQVSINEASNY